MRSFYLILPLILISTSVIHGCLDEDNTEEEVTPEYPNTMRGEKIPDDIEKRGPDTDPNPPILHSDLFSEPVPLEGPINTAGAEDSPFILPEGGRLYFFFTPDVRVSPEKQLLDNVTGIWVSKKIGGEWTEPERVWLQDPGKLSLDGAHWVGEDEIWFGSAREGYTGVNIFIAERTDGTWSNWRYAGDLLNIDYRIGEIHKVGDTIYFHSDRAGGKGEYDIWKTTLRDGSWQGPVNIDEVNSPVQDSLPWVNETEMYFTRTYKGTPAIFRSVRKNGSWSEGELVLSRFAGEPTLDGSGNLYFVHHYYEDDEMIEADIYYCERIG